MSFCISKYSFLLSILMSFTSTGHTQDITISDPALFEGLSDGQSSLGEI